MMRIILILMLTIFSVSEGYALSLKEFTQKAIENNKELNQLRGDLQSVEKQLDSLDSSVNYDELSDEEQIKLEQMEDVNKFRKHRYSLRKKILKSDISTSMNNICMSSTEAYIRALKEMRHSEIDNKLLNLRKSSLGQANTDSSKEIFGDAYNKALNTVTIQELNKKESVSALSYFADGVDSYTVFEDPLILVNPNLDFEQLLRQTLTTHPLIMSAKENLDLAKLDSKRKGIIISKKLREPVKDINGDYTFFSKNRDFTNTEEMAKYLGDIEKDSSINKIGEEQVQRRAEALKHSMDKVEKELTLAWEMQTSVKTKFEKLKELHKTAKKELENIYREGMISKQPVADVIAKEESYVKSLKSLVDARYEYIVTKFKLMEASGVCKAAVDNARNDREAEMCYASALRENFNLVKCPSDKVVVSKEVSGVTSPIVQPVMKIELPEDDLASGIDLDSDISLSSESEQTIASTPESNLESADDEPDCYYVSTKILNIRDNPSDNADRLGIYKFKDKVCGYQKMGEWLRTSRGWISTEALSAVEPELKEKIYKFVSTKMVNVRSAPNLQSEVKLNYVLNDKIEVLGVRSDWTKTPEGWVKSRFLSNDITEEAVYKYVKLKKLNIRKSPRLSSGIAGTYLKGEKIEIIEQQNLWGKTSKGWVYLKHLSDEKISASQAVAKKKAPKKSGIIYRDVATKRLNIRTRPTLDSISVGTYSEGTRLAIIKENGGWSKTVRGWVKTKFLSKDSKTLICKNVTATKLNVRWSASMNAKIVSSYKNGDRVCILKKHKEWVYTGVGWIKAEYLK